MKYKLIKRRLSISAPSMTIRQQLPLPLRVLFYVLAIALGSAITFWAYDLGMNFTGANPTEMRDQITTLNQKIKDLTAERDQLSSMANASESQLNMVRATGNQFANQIKILESENVRLKEDLAFFESLLPTNIGSQGITIQRFRADLITPNQLRYRLLVIQGQATREFAGDLGLAVTVFQGGKNIVLNFPDANKGNTDTARFKLSFKYYQRVEGVLTLPEGASVKSVQAKVLVGGQVRAQQAVNL